MPHLLRPLQVFFHILQGGLRLGLRLRLVGLCTGPRLFFRSLVFGIFLRHFHSRSSTGCSHANSNNFPQNPIFLRSCLQMLKLEYTGLFLWPMRKGTCCACHPSGILFSLYPLLCRLQVKKGPQTWTFCKFCPIRAFSSPGFSLWHPSVPSLTSPRHLLYCT